MVDRQREITHGAHRDGFAAARFNHADAALNFADTENRDLRLIDDDGSCEQASADAVVRDREGASAHILRLEPTRTRTFHQRIETPGNVEQAQSLSAVNDWPIIPGLCACHADATLRCTAWRLAMA